jgi:ketosteroid isomerase-like protein
VDTTEDIAALAGRFIDAVEAGDVGTAMACYAPDARIWHNTDGREQSPAENAAVLEGFVKGVPTRSYDERRLNAFPGGFVEQHVLRGSTRGGVSFELAACIVCEVKAGKITRLDEYFDSAAVAALTRSA